MPMEGNLNKGNKGDNEKKEAEEMLFLAKKYRIFHKIEDSINQFVVLGISNSFEGSKAIIGKSKLKKLEEFLFDFSKEDIEKSYPGISEKIDGFVEKLESAELTEEEFNGIMREINVILNRLRKEGSEILLKLMH